MSTGSDNLAFEAPGMWLRRVRLTVRLLMGVVAIVATVLGFATWVTRETPIFVEPAEPPRWANTDHELFDIVLTDLIDDPEFNNSISGSGPKLTQIVFNAVTGGPLPRGAFDHDPYLREQSVTQEVLDDLAERNPQGKRLSLGDYHPSNQNIAAALLSRSEMESRLVSRFPSACGAVVPFLPGYSRDGKTALFHFYSMPLGSGRGWYLLKKAGGRWVISGKHFYWFCQE